MQSLTHLQDQDPGEVPDGVTQALASKGGLSAGVKPVFEVYSQSCRLGADISHSQASSAPQVSGMKRMVSRIHCSVQELLEAPEIVHEVLELNHLLVQVGLVRHCLLPRNS